MSRVFFGAALSIALLCAASLGRAQGNPPDIEPPHAAPILPTVPPEISPDCRTPGLSISGATPLPNLMEALKTRRSIRIMSIGASYFPTRRGENYFDLIARALENQAKGVDVQIIDRGVSGELARDASHRLKLEVALTSPDLVIWQVGTNDALAHIPVEEFAETVTETIRWLKDHDVDVALVGLHYIRSLRKDPTYQETRRALNRIAEAEKVLRIGRYEAGQIIEQLQTSGPDRLPNEFALTESGYGCLAEYVARALTSGLFARKPNTKRPPM